MIRKDQRIYDPQVDKRVHYEDKDLLIIRCKEEGILCLASDTFEEITIPYSGLSEARIKSPGTWDLKLGDTYTHGEGRDIFQVVGGYKGHWNGELVVENEGAGRIKGARRIKGAKYSTIVDITHLLLNPIVLSRIPSPVIGVCSICGQDSFTLSNGLCASCEMILSEGGEKWN